jgi:hypothetical protein
MVKRKISKSRVAEVENLLLRGKDIGSVAVWCEVPVSTVMEIQKQMKDLPCPSHVALP